MRFIRDWDVKMISLLLFCGEEKAVLTCQPRPYQRKADSKRDDFEEGPPGAICFRQFSQLSGLPQFQVRPLHSWLKAAQMLT